MPAAVLTGKNLYGSVNSKYYKFIQLLKSDMVWSQDSAGQSVSFRPGLCEMSPGSNPTLAVTFISTILPRTLWVRSVILSISLPHRSLAQWTGQNKKKNLRLEKIYKNLNRNKNGFNFIKKVDLASSHKFFGKACWSSLAVICGSYF